VPYKIVHPLLKVHTTFNYIVGFYNRA